MKAFFDESGLNPKTDRAFVMGGFLGTSEEWDRVLAAWCECLNIKPTIKYFKSEEANRLSGEFQRVSRESAQEKRMTLARILGASSLQGFCATVSYTFFEGRDPKATKGHFGTRPYDWGFLTATSGVLQYVRDHHPYDTVDFIFDERNELVLCISHFDELKAMKDTPWAPQLSRAGTCVSDTDTTAPGLQMADMLCSEFSFMVNRKEKPTAVWRELTRKRGVAHVPCAMPPPIPYLIALQGLSKTIRDSAGDFLRRLYRENERSPEMVRDFSQIEESKSFFDASMRTMLELHETNPEFRRFVERMKAKEK